MYKNVFIDFACAKIRSILYYAKPFNYILSNQV